jgi:predicted dinucleotide-binding enzyme
MKIVTIGRGTIGGGLANLWRDAGHEVDELGRGGGDASDADAVLVAVPGAMISPALTRIRE